MNTLASSTRVLEDDDAAPNVATLVPVPVPESIRSTRRECPNVVAGFVAKQLIETAFAVEPLSSTHGVRMQRGCHVRPLAIHFARLFRGFLLTNAFVPGDVRCGFGTTRNAPYAGRVQGRLSSALTYLLMG